MKSVLKVSSTLQDKPRVTPSISQKSKPSTPPAAKEERIPSAIPADDENDEVGVIVCFDDMYMLR